MVFKLFSNVYSETISEMNNNIYYHNFKSLILFCIVQSINNTNNMNLSDNEYISK